jgi:hypothetical protein
MDNLKQLVVKIWKRVSGTNWIRFWIYGDSGVGKTRFGATWPNPIFLLADPGGLMSVDTEVGVIEVGSWLDLQNAFMYLQDEQHSYQTVVLDTLNEIQHLAMRNVLEKYPHIKRSYSSLPGMSDYGKALNDFELLIRAFLTLPMHIVFISQLKKKEFETDPVLPQLTGKNTASNIARLMSVIGFMYRQAVTLPEGGTKVVPVLGFNEVEHQSKDRTGCLPDTILEPTYAACAQYWASM